MMRSLSENMPGTNIIEEEILEVNDDDGPTQEEKDQQKDKNNLGLIIDPSLPDSICYSGNNFIVHWAKWGSS